LHLLLWKQEHGRHMISTTEVCRRNQNPFLALPSHDDVEYNSESFQR